MKTLQDVLLNDNLNDILTQFNDYEYSAAMATICMCVEEYCLAHNLDATETFERMLETNRAAVRDLGVYGHEDEEYIPSSTMGDYGPSNPWDAPGMSEKDFI